MAEQNEGESALESSKYEDSEAEHEGRPDLHKCAEEFSHFCQVDVSKEKEGIESVIEDMLVRLDEFSHLADTIRNDSTQSFTVLLPQLNTQCQQMPELFKKIDHLEAFVNKVKRNVDEMEEKVNIAEKELSTHSIKKVLSSLPLRALLQKRHSSPPKPEKGNLEWSAPAIFKTSDFFGPQLSSSDPEHMEEVPANVRHGMTGQKGGNLHPKEELTDGSEHEGLSPS